MRRFFVGSLTCDCDCVVYEAGGDCVVYEAAGHAPGVNIAELVDFYREHHGQPPEKSSCCPTDGQQKVEALEKVVTNLRATADHLRLLLEREEKASERVSEDLWAMRKATGRLCEIIGVPAYDDATDDEIARHVADRCCQLLDGLGILSCPSQWGSQDEVDAHRDAINRRLNQKDDQPPCCPPGDCRGTGCGLTAVIGNASTLIKSMTVEHRCETVTVALIKKYVGEALAHLTDVRDECGPAEVRGARATRVLTEFITLVDPPKEPPCD